LSHARGEARLGDRSRDKTSELCRTDFEPQSFVEGFGGEVVLPNEVSIQGGIESARRLLFEAFGTSSLRRSPIANG